VDKVTRIDRTNHQRRPRRRIRSGQTPESPAAGSRTQRSRARRRIRSGPAPERRMVIDYFGGCPECGGSDRCLHVGPEHWMVCDTHRAKWCVGVNLFSVWRYYTEEDFEQNRAILATYAEVEPLPWTGELDVCDDCPPDPPF
jgi:hypothetical protein